MIPASSVPAAMPNTMASGCTFTARPSSSGCRMCPSTCCTSSTTPSRISAVTGPFATSAISTAISPDRVAPTIGMNENRNTSTASADADADRVDERDRDRRVDVADQRPPGPLARAGDPLPAAPREEPDQPGPDLPAVLDEEDRREQRQQQAGDDLAGRAGRPERAAGQPGPVLRQRVAGALDVVVELLLGQPERAVDQPVLDLVDPTVDLGGEVAETVAELLLDQPDQQADTDHP